MRKLEEAIEEAWDFKAESEAVAAILKDVSDDDYDTPTQFKGWTIYDILAHLHLWNMAAAWTLTVNGVVIGRTDVGIFCAQRVGIA